MKSRIPFLIGTCLWAGLIFLLSSRNGGQNPPMPHPVDWIVHAGAFFGLAYLLCLAIGSPRWFWLAALVVSLYGAVDEIHQSFVPGRSSTVSDWVADTAGATAASIAWFLAWRQGRASRPT